MFIDLYTNYFYRLRKLITIWEHRIIVLGRCCIVIEELLQVVLKHIENQPFHSPCLKRVAVPRNILLTENLSPLVKERKRCV